MQIQNSIWEREEQSIENREQACNTSKTWKYGHRGNRQIKILRRNDEQQGKHGRPYTYDRRKGGSSIPDNFTYSKRQQFQIYQNGSNMEAIRNMHIIPIIMYGAESRITTKRETEKFTTIINSIIKRILRVPQSTPNDAITIETGILDIQTLTEIKQINNHMRISNMDNGREIKAIWKNSKKCGKHIQNIKTKYNLENIETKNMSKKWKKEYIHRG